tara:strand:- start:17223 stop:22001 length:4779 start_codon:yes stop_codon:yes gene_type:complete
MAINRFNTPAEQNLMQTYVPLPFQEMTAAAQMIQGRHDKAETLAESLDDNLLNIKANRELDKRYLSDYKTNLDNELSALITKHDGKYADMLPDLKLIQKRVNRDLTSGDLATIKSSGEQLALYNQGVLDTKQDEKYDPYLDLMLGAGGDRASWMSEGMKNIGTDEQPNYVIDEEYYQNTVVGAPLSSYKYTGVWQASDMLAQLDKVYGKIKPDSQEIEYDQVQEDGTTRRITEKLENISPAKIANAALNNMSSLSPNAKAELSMWSSSLDDNTTLAYADAFLQTLLSDEMGQASTQDEIDAINERYSNMWADMTDENGNLTQQARTYAELWNINEEGRKYIKGETTLKDLENTKGKYKNNGGSGTTHTYRIIDTGQGSEIQITPVVDEFGDDIKENSNDKLYLKWEDSVNQNHINYTDALDEYLKFKEQTPGDTSHLEELLQIVNSTRYTYESNAFIRQMMTQEAAINANYKHVGVGGTGTETNAAGYFNGDITYGANNSPLDVSFYVGAEMPGTGSGGHLDMRYNVDVIFDDEGNPVDPLDSNAIWAHIKSRTFEDENGVPTGFAWGGYGYGDEQNPTIFDDDPESETYGQNIPNPNYVKGYSGSNIYNPYYTGDTPLDKAKVKLYEDRKDMLFGGRTRQITELAGTGNKKVDEQIRTAITENWLNDDFMFMGNKTDTNYSFLEDPGTQNTEALKDIVADINGDGATNQEDVMEFLQQVKDGDVRILWESVPNSEMNDGAGGYRGVVKIPTETGAQPLYFTAPQAYLNEIMTYHVDIDGNYTEMAPNQKQLKWMNYTAQIDLDKATRMPGNVVPSATADANGNPIGYYYFGVNPNDGSPLRSDEYIFVPNKNIITAVDVVDGQIKYTRATGEPSGAIDVDDNTRDLARILMLNDPKQASTKEYWQSQLDITPDTEPITKEFNKNKPTINPNDPGTIVDNNINIEEEDDIIVVNPNKNPNNTNNNQMPPEPIIDGPPEGFDENGDRIQEEIISLEPIKIDAAKFEEAYIGAKDKMDDLIIKSESVIDPDDVRGDIRDDLDLNFQSNDAIVTSLSDDGAPGFIKSQGPGAIVITQPGDETFPEGAMMDGEYRIWNLTTGQQLDKNGKVIGPREYDHYYYQNDEGTTTLVDFTLSDNIDADGQPLEGDGSYDIDLDGNPIKKDPIVNPNEDPNDIIIDENPDDATLPNSGAPNQIVDSAQTYNTTTTFRNGNVQTSTFTVKPGQVWFDDSYMTYHNWAMHRGDNQMLSQPMQVKSQLLDAVNQATETINKDMFDIFAGLYGGIGGGALQQSATTYGAATILGWVDPQGNVYEYKGFQFSDDQDTYIGELPEGQDNLELQWSDNYDDQIHNRDGTVKDEFLKDRNQILNGNFPSIEMLADETITLSDGSSGTFESLLNSGKIALQTKTGVNDPFMRNGSTVPTGTVFNIPMADVWRSYESQERAYKKYKEYGGSPTAPPGTSFHEAGQAFDMSQSDNDYGIYIVDLTQGEGSGTMGNNNFKPTSFFGMTTDQNAIQLDDIIHNGTRPWSGMDNEIQKLVTQRLIDLNKKDGYTLAQLSASNPEKNEWWHFSIGEMTQYRDPLMPGNKYGTYKYVR